MKGTEKALYCKTRKMYLAVLFVFAYTLAPSPYTLSVGAQERLKVKSEESLFLDLQKTGLGSLSEFEEKKRFLGTVQLEKEKIQKKMLKSIYDSAFEYYRQSNYEEATDLASKILSIDPNFSDAAMLLEAANQLRGGQRAFMSEKLLIEDRFKRSLVLYNEGRIVEAHKKMEEVEKLSPNNIKAKYWIGRMKDDLKQYYFEQGEEAYKARDLKGALDNLYNALFLRPKDTLIVQRIMRVEDDLRQARANEALKAALELYAQGKLKEAYEGLKRVLDIQPADSKANKLLSEVKGEIEQSYISNGKKLYSGRRYNEAIAEWDSARPYSLNIAYLDELVFRARKQMRLETDEKRRRTEETARRVREEEANRKAEEEERKKAEEEAKRRGVSGEDAKARQPQGITEENRLAAQQHYLEGLKYFQNANYDKARDEWTISKQLDPSNSDAGAGLKRIEQILAGGQ
ncbi:MAG TPA: hypothetical protein DCL44_03235 [Elusimicrobia bacterium]|nr:hypothetical protein [Elusimicrobiota bacterium]